MIDQDQLCEVADAFAVQFVATEPIGTIPGEIEFPAQIVSVGYTPAAPSALRDFRCPSGESAILIRWVPAKWARLHTVFLKLLAKLNIYPPGIPPKQQWVQFPRHFLEVPVYYKRGGRFVPHATKR